MKDDPFDKLYRKSYALPEGVCAVLVVLLAALIGVLFAWRG